MKHDATLVKHILLLACGKPTNRLIGRFEFNEIGIDVFDVLIMIFVKLVFLRVIMPRNMMEIIRLKNIVNKYEKKI